MDFTTGQYNTDQNVMWDFRQFYVDWVKNYIIAFSEAHFSNNYYKMIEALKKWHGVIWGRAIKNYEEGTKRDKVFDGLKGNIISLSNDSKYRNTYFGKDRNPEAVDELDRAIEAMLVYIIWLMKKHKLFGSDSINRGL